MKSMSLVQQNFPTLFEDDVYDSDLRQMQLVLYNYPFLIKKW